MTMYDDPVAQAIRREQQADARPSKEEVKQLHRDHLAHRGCLVCGIDDPDRLTMVRVQRFPKCSAWGQPRHEPDTAVLCDEHRRPGRVLARAREYQNARKDPDCNWLVRYGCGTIEHVDDADLSNPDGPDPRPHHPRERHAPKHFLACRCGEPITEVEAIEHDP